MTSSPCTKFSTSLVPNSAWRCIKSDGGSGEAALRLVHLLRQYAKSVVALIPLECASAATMLAIGADELQMGPLAHLTAVDTSLRHELSPVDVDNELVSVSQDELIRVVRLWQASVQPGSKPKDGDVNPYQALYPHIHPLVIGAVATVSRRCRSRSVVRSCRFT